MLRPAPPSRVRFCTVLEVRDARWNSRSSAGVVEPAARADSSPTAQAILRAAKARGASLARSATLTACASR